MRSHQGAHLLHDNEGTELVGENRSSTRINLGKLQQVIGEFQDVLGTPVDILEILFLACGQGTHPLILEELGVSQNPRQGCPDFLGEL